jgi:hypothetical protein
MEILLIIALVLLLLAVLGVLGRGIFLMASGGDSSSAKQNKAMQWRVLLQAGAIIVVVLILALASGN